MKNNFHLCTLQINIIMKKILLLASFLFITLFSFAQNGLLVQNGAKGLYISHTVQPKENYYSIGRNFNVPPKELAAYNGMDMSVGLNVGQTILIPLTAANFSQTTASGTPVYYVVGDKEGLYRVSVNNGKVLMANLRKWNNLSSDVISSGQRLIVGYLTGSDASTPTIASTPPVKKEETSQPLVSEPVKQGPPQKETEKQTDIKPPVKMTSNTNVATNDAMGGYFKSAFEQQSKAGSAGKETTATSGIFKTASGWQDGKYYALMDGVDPGTIVRVSNPANGKVIYAKVLGQMSGIRQNAGLELRISNAAASILEISDTDKFIVRVDH